MPKYRFQWEALPPSALRRLKSDLDLVRGRPEVLLRQAYGARPNEDFVKDAWPTLLDTWLTRDATSRRSLVSALRSRHLGDYAGQLRSAGAELDYLRSCRNSPSLRELVLVHLIAAGERTPPPKPARAPDASLAGPTPTPSHAASLGSAPERSTAWTPFTEALATTLAALEAGEAKWAVAEDARTLVGALPRKVERGLHRDPETLGYAVCARTTLTNVEEGVVALTAAELFSIDQVGVRGSGRRRKS